MMSIAAQVEKAFVTIRTPEDLRRIALGARKTRRLAVGAGPGRITTNIAYGRTGRPMGLGQTDFPQNAKGNTPGFPGAYGCSTYANPRLPPPDQNACPGGWNGCGDTVGINVQVGANATVGINVAAAIEFTPRFFLFTGADATFTIDRVVVANGADSHFGVGYAAEVYAIDNFVGRDVSWPTFYNSPPLTITVTNLTGMAANFTGVLKGVAAHQ